MGKDLPPRGKSTGRKPLYRYRELNVGETLVLNQKGKKKQSAINAARNYGRKYDVRFAVRTDNDTRITTLIRIA